MKSVPTYDIVFHLFAISAAPQKRDSVFHQASMSITNVVQKIVDIKLNYYVLDIIVLINPVCSRGIVVSLITETMLVAYGEKRVRSRKRKKTSF